MVDKYAKRPFAMLGVNRDPVEVGAAAARDKKMTWMNFSEGEKAKVSAAYHVSSFPTVCVVDAQGVVRLYGDGMMLKTGEVQALVEKLVKQAEAK